MARSDFTRPAGSLQLMLILASFLATLPLAAQGKASLRLPPAPYVAPTVGTRFVYTDGAVTVTGTQQWRYTVRDQRGVKADLVGGFIPDATSSPLVLAKAEIAKLWPLREGNTMVLMAQRFPDLFGFDLRVIGTERITVPAGAFDCFVVQSVQARQSGNKRLPLARFRYWYAPAIAAVVRAEADRSVPGLSRPPSVIQLVRLERPGKPAVGAPIKRAPPRARPKNKP